MKNKITDLNNHLFAMLERLGDEEMSEADLEREVKRAGAIVSVSEQVLTSARLELGVAKLVAEHSGYVPAGLPLLNTPHAGPHTNGAANGREPEQ